jgi:sortase A
VRPGGDLGRAELRRPAPLQAVRAAQAPQVAQVTRAREPGNGEDGGENVVLTIPWPAVPVSGDSDPRRRVPLGALLTGVVGELLITAGLLLGLYVVWEIVWSSVEAKPYQVAALEVIHERPGYVAPASDDAEYAPEYTENIPTVPGAAHGEAWVSLHVPRWGYGYDVAVAEGTDKYATLDKGLIGHYTSTQNPGELGNFAVAAHRITHGEPFAGIMELRVGDDLIVETDEYYLVYKMTDHSIVVPTDMSVIWPVPGQEGVEPARRLITLTTCHPRYTSTHRYIVVGEFEYWTKKTEGRLRALVPPGER